MFQIMKFRIAQYIHNIKINRPYKKKQVKLSILNHSKLKW